jgi:gluconolactonase
MYRNTLSLSTLLLLLINVVYAQKESNIVRMDPALDALVPAGAKVEKVVSGFGFIEGPVWAKEGYLLFSDIPRSKIYKWTPKGDTSVFLYPSGKSNGITLDKQGRLYLAQHEDRRIARLEKNGKLITVVDKYEGKRLNSPNDLVMSRSGAIYFTDPPWGLAKTDNDPAKELPFNGLFLFHNNKLVLLDSTLFRPNGVALSPDEKYLYVGEFDGKKELWLQYDIKKDGTVANKKVLFDASSHSVRGNPDGMKVDTKGNLYCTGPGGLWILSPKGKALGLIELPELPANCAWGDADGKTLYMTSRTGLYRIKLAATGVRPVAQ